MKISVLISVYAKEKPEYLRQALKSIWDDQVLKPNEIVLVQDGPLPEMLKKEINIFQKHVGHAFKFIILEQNGGLTKALNIGIRECTGELIARMDSDDISSPNRFKIQHEFFCKHPETDVLGGALLEFNNDNPFLAQRFYPENSAKAREYIVKASPMAHPTVMFNRKIFDAGFKYNENYRTSQDLELWFRLLASNHHLANVPDIVLHYRQNSDFVKRRSYAKAINEFKIYRKGILELHGLTWKLIYPLMRLTFRLAPGFIIKKTYSGRFRQGLNN